MPINKSCAIIKNLHEFQIFLWHSIIFSVGIVLRFCKFMLAQFLQHFCNVVFFYFLFWLKQVSTSLSHGILWRDTELFFVSLTGLTTYQHNLLLNACGPPFLSCSTWIDSSAIVLFAPMSSPTEIFPPKFS